MPDNIVSLYNGTLTTWYEGQPRPAHCVVVCAVDDPERDQKIRQATSGLPPPTKEKIASRSNQRVSVL